MCKDKKKQSEQTNIEKLSRLFVFLSLVTGVIITIIYFFSNDYVVDKATRFYDFAGAFTGILSPFVSILTLFAIWYTFSSERKDNAIKDKELKQSENFMKMYEAYIHTVTMCSRVIKPNNIPIEIKGRQFIEAFTESSLIKKLCELPPNEDSNVVFHDGRAPREAIYNNPDNSHRWQAIVEQINAIDGWPQLMPTFRMAFHLLKRELAQDGLQKYDNIRFFRAQLTEPELIALAINALFNDEGRKGIAIVAAKSGLFRHLKAENLKRLIRREFPEMQAGFFDIKLTEDELKEQPFIFKKADK